MCGGVVVDVLERFMAAAHGPEHFRRRDARDNIIVFFGFPLAFNYNPLKFDLMPLHGRRGRSIRRAGPTLIEMTVNAMTVNRTHTTGAEIEAFEVAEASRCARILTYIPLARPVRTIYWLQLTF